MTMAAKTFRVDAKLRNNLLIRAREALGYKNAVQAAEALGLSYPSLIGYEGLVDLPWRTNGEWKQSAVVIATAYKAVPEMLWPDEICGVKRTRTSMEIDVPAAFLEPPKNPEEKLKEKEKEFQTMFSNPYLAAGRGFIDEVIEPSQTRAKLISAFAMLENKVAKLPRKKHGNIPL